MCVGVMHTFPSMSVKTKRIAVYTWKGVFGGVLSQFLKVQRLGSQIENLQSFGLKQVRELCVEKEKTMIGFPWFYSLCIVF